MKLRSSLCLGFIAACLQSAAAAKPDLPVYDTLTFQRNIKTLTVNPLLKVTEITVESKSASPLSKAAFDILNHATAQSGTDGKSLLKTAFNNGKFVVGILPPPSENHKFLQDEFLASTQNCLDKLAEDDPDKFDSVVAIYFDKSPMIQTVARSKEAADRMVELYSQGQCSPAGNSPSAGMDLIPLLKASLAGVLYNGEEGGIFLDEKALNVYGFIGTFIFGRDRFRDRAPWTAYSSKLIEDRLKNTAAAALPAYDLINAISDKRYASFINFLFETKQAQANLQDDSFKELGRACFDNLDAIFDSEFILSKCIVDHDVKVRSVKAFGKSMLIFSKD